MRLDLTDLDLTSMLDALGIEWEDESHPNVTRHCIGICCPYCGDDDYHCGIFKSGKNFSCFRCQSTGPFFSLVNRITGIGWREFLSWVELHGRPQQQSGGADAVTKVFQGGGANADSAPKTYVTLPPYCRSIDNAMKLSPPFRKFAKKRRFPPETFEAWGCQVCIHGKWAHRLIIPIKDKGKMIGFQCRAMLDDMEPKYDSPPGVRISDYLYNLEKGLHEGTMILVEGVFDVWRLGEGSVATFGSHVSSMQRNRILEVEPSELVFAWDNDPDSDIQTRALNAARQWLPFVERVKVITLPERLDPDDAGKDLVGSLIEEAEPLS
jgi:hypothetical protein